MKDKNRKLRVTCPCCGAQLMIEAGSGAVLHAEKPREKKASFEEMLGEFRKKKEHTEEAFQKAFEDEKRRKEALEQKFEHARKHADELPEPPPKPFDLD